MEADHRLFTGYVVSNHGIVHEISCFNGEIRETFTSATKAGRQRLLRDVKRSANSVDDRYPPSAITNERLPYYRPAQAATSGPVSAARLNFKQITRTAGPAPRTSDSEPAHINQCLDCAGRRSPTAEKRLESTARTG
jgi:hypothetical protein